MTTGGADLAPESWEGMPGFQTLKLPSSNLGPRLGRLFRSGTSLPIDTPHYAATTSRGVVPHISHDNLQRHTSISAVHLGLEDFIEKGPQHAPIFDTPTSGDKSPLRKYTALPNQCLSILGPRRVPPITCPAQQTASSISISTSVGFRQLEVEEYVAAAQKLRADISVSIADIISSGKPSTKRIEKSADRTHAWLRNSFDRGSWATSGSLGLLASIPPVPKEHLSFYFAELEEDFRSQLGGLALYKPETAEALPSTLADLPRLCLSEPDSPHAILKSIRLGVDLITVPFVTSCSEHGIALTFELPTPVDHRDRPLGYDLWSTKFVTDLAPLQLDCTCYACKKHHRAYMHHLLQAKEMLAWTLLQIHNFAVMDRFFKGIRTSISNATFESDADGFTRAYQTNLPEQVGEGPRVRGYQMKSVGGGELKRNPKAYGKLDYTIQRLVDADSEVTTPTGDAGELEEHCFASRM